MLESHFREDYLECEERFHRFQKRRDFLERSLPLITGGSAVRVDRGWFDKVERALDDYDDNIMSLPELLTEPEFDHLSKISNRIHELLDHPPDVPAGLEALWKEERPG